MENDYRKETLHLFPTRSDPLDDLGLAGVLGSCPILPGERERERDRVIGPAAVMLAVGAANKRWLGSGEGEGIVGWEDGGDSRKLLAKRPAGGSTLFDRMMSGEMGEGAERGSIGAVSLTWVMVPLKASASASATPGAGGSFPCGSLFTGIALTSIGFPSLISPSSGSSKVFPSPPFSDAGSAIPSILRSGYESLK